MIWRMVLSHLLAATLAVILLAGAASAQETAITVTSDSTEYCGTLDRMLAEGEGPRSDEVLRLMREGDEMCAGGEVRGGITRLRRALMIWRQGHDSASAGGAGFGHQDGGKEEK